MNFSQFSLYFLSKITRNKRKNLPKIVGKFYFLFSRRKNSNKKCQKFAANFLLSIGKKFPSSNFTLKIANKFLLKFLFFRIDSQFFSRWQKEEEKKKISVFRTEVPRWHWRRGRSSLSVITCSPTLDHLAPGDHSKARKKFSFSHAKLILRFCYFLNVYFLQPKRGEKKSVG